jgi:hypothetical protein
LPGAKDVPTTTKEIADSLVAIKTRLDQQFTANGWSRTTPMLSIFGGYAPPMTAAGVGSMIDSLAGRINSLAKPDLEKDDLGDFLATVPTQANAINFGNLTSDPDAVSGGLMMFLQTVATQLPPRALPKPQVDWEQIKDKELLPKDLARRLRSVEAKLKDIEPRSAEIEKKIEDIEAAHAAAEQLPTDLEELASNRAALAETVEDAQKLAAKIGETTGTATQCLDQIQAAQTRADKLIERSEQALRGSTGVGLAASFEKRKQNLTWAVVYWTLGLLTALSAALYIGEERVTALKDVLTGHSSPTVIWVNALLAVLGIGAPIWFAWLSTKQIWTNFRLAEDYAYKASVSKAYEGYRAEAVDIDPVLQRRLFESALTRLEETPIRLLDMKTHGSPLHELLDSPAIRKALEGVPGIADKIVALIPTKAGPAAAVIGSAAAATAAAAALGAAGGSNPEEAEKS